MIIKSLSAHKVLDSRKEPTIEVSVNSQKASSPSGKSTGKYETSSYHSSLEWNIKAINKLSIPFEINSFHDLSKVEKLIKNQFRLKNAKQFGANALFALESAILKALAKEKKQELWELINPKAKRMPVPVGNAIGGGLHSHLKNHPIFQEFLIIPKRKSIFGNVKAMQSVYDELSEITRVKKVNDEGALETNYEEEAILKVLSKYKKEVNLGVDIAASSFFRNNKYNYNDKTLLRQEQIDYVNELIKKYNLFYVEDPLNEEDFSGFSEISSNRNSRALVLIVGDDLTATHISRVKKAVKIKSINAIIIKPNQNGSLLELAEIIKFCKKHKIKTILSHRSGETLDNALADYAFAFQCDFIKCGIATKWREVKLKRLIEIEKSLK